MPAKAVKKPKLVHVIPLLEKCYRFLLYTTQISNHGVLISLSRHNRMPQTVWLKQPKFIFPHFSRLENPRSRPSRVRFLVGASLLACRSRLLTRGRERERESELSGSLLLRALILSDQDLTLMISLNFNNLPICPISKYCHIRGYGFNIWVSRETWVSFLPMAVKLFMVGYFPLSVVISSPATLDSFWLL